MFKAENENLSCWKTNKDSIDTLNAQCDIKKGSFWFLNQKKSCSAASEISKNVVNTMKACGQIFQSCKNLEDEAVAYVSR